MKDLGIFELSIAKILCRVDVPPRRVISKESVTYMVLAQTWATHNVRDISKHEFPPY